MLNRGTCDCVSNLFIADEAQLLVPKILHKIVVTESWPATEFAVRLRKRGCGLLLITQSPSNIEKDIFKNVGTKFAFRLQFEEDIRLISEAAGFFDQVEFEYLADRMVRLPQKTAVVCTSGHEPFLMTTDDFDIPSFNVKVEKLEELDDLSEIYDRDETTFLESIEREPFISVRGRRAALGWNDRRYYKTVESLTKKGAIEIETVRMGRGSPTVLYQKKGSVPSVRHEYYVHWINKWLKAKGFETKTNVKEGPDIVIPKIRTAIEVELGRSDVHSNIERNVHQFDRVIVCSDQKKLIESLSRQTESNKILFLPIEKVPAAFEKILAGNELVDI
jgi:hypothetical protein